jgi:FdhD protein
MNPLKTLADSAQVPVREQADAGSVLRPVERRGRDGVERSEDWIASEVPVALHYNGRAHAVMLATPCDLEDFALGFSLSEAVIEHAGDLASIDIQPRLEGIEIALRIPGDRAELLDARQRNLVGNSSCGLCGTRQLEAVLRHPPAPGPGPCVNAAAVHRALSSLASAQPLNRCTGATHAAAWSDGAGALLLVREDVGRHNALDKLIGAMTRQGLDVQGGFLVLTSRASYEMVQKATTVGIGLIVAISAPTALAIHLAESTRATLLGFARDAGHVVYTHPQRVIVQTE